MKYKACRTLIIIPNSIVAGGLEVISYTIRFTCFTSFTILLVVFPMTSHGIFCAFGCHEIGSGYGTEGDSIIIRSFISHDSDRTHIGQCCEVLADFVSDSGFVNFFTPDCVGILNHFNFLSGYFTDDTNTKTRTWEWLTEYKIFRNSEFKTGFSYFIFEKVAQWLDDFFEIYVIRQSSDIMVRFDNGGFSADTTLYNVWVDGSLYQEVYSTNFLCFFFEDADELFADDFTFSLRLFYAF